MNGKYGLYSRYKDLLLVRFDIVDNYYIGW